MSGASGLFSTISPTEIQTRHRGKKEPFPWTKAFRVPFAIGRNEAAQSFRTRLETGVRPDLDAGLHPVFAHLINECIKLEDVDPAGNILNPRMTFDQIVTHLEMHKGEFVVEEAL